MELRASQLVLYDLQMGSFEVIKSKKKYVEKKKHSLVVTEDRNEKNKADENRVKEKSEKRVTVYFVSWLKL